ncbi:glycerophosphodiester phosphodiesterase family protein [Kineococcus gynurae]|uniref:Glycerophosphodiester phosphodiesterase family protein n=1 Tax=Kineococcus gynurae TaxID=452979 RepID=A0ABV5LQY7_9ACTN
MGPSGGHGGAAWPPPRHPFCAVGTPFAMAHRGFSLDGRENSLAAFAAAADLGLTHVETDVRCTADGVLVAFHDDRLDRVTDSVGLLAETSWDRVARARIGGREAVPRFEEVLAAFPQLRINVDCKVAEAVEPLAEVVRRTRSAERLLITSFSERVRQAVVTAAHSSAGRVATSVGSARVAAVLAAARAGSRFGVRAALAGADALQIPVRTHVLGMSVPVVTERLVELVHAGGAQVHCWTIDDPVQMSALLDLGVDAVITDRADLARAELLRRGGPGPS